jgi:hypothetical protein
MKPEGLAAMELFTLSIPAHQPLTSPGKRRKKEKHVSNLSGKFQRKMLPNALKLLSGHRQTPVISEEAASHPNSQPGMLCQ